MSINLLPTMFDLLKTLMQVTDCYHGKGHAGTLRRIFIFKTAAY